MWLGWVALGSTTYLFRLLKGGPSWSKDRGACRTPGPAEDLAFSQSLGSIDDAQRGCKDPLILSFSSRVTRKTLDITVPISAPQT